MEDSHELPSLQAETIKVELMKLETEKKEVLSRVSTGLGGG
jgi:hypothetical protein